MADHYPGIPGIDGAIPREIRSVLGPMREILRMFTDPTNPAIRAGMLASAGLIDSFQQGAIVPTTAYDGTPPPAPTGLEAAGALANVILSWDAAPFDGIAYTEIWRAETDSIALAQKIGTSPGQVYVDAIGAGATRYYWIRYISLANNPGPFNAQAGTLGATAYDASYLLDVLAANPPAGADYNPLLYVQPDAIVIDGITVPAGVYMASAYIRALSVTNAQIANLAVDSAKIANAAIIEAKIANAAITSAKIANAAITEAKIEDAAITSAKIEDAAITNAKILDLDADKIHAETITASKIISNGIATITLGSMDLGPINVTTRGTNTWALWQWRKAYTHVFTGPAVLAASANVELNDTFYYCMQSSTLVKFGLNSDTGTEYATSGIIVQDTASTSTFFISVRLVITSGNALFSNGDDEIIFEMTPATSNAHYGDAFQTMVTTATRGAAITVDVYLCPNTVAAMTAMNNGTGEGPRRQALPNSNVSVRTTVI